MLSVCWERLGGGGGVLILMYGAFVGCREDIDGFRGRRWCFVFSEIWGFGRWAEDVWKVVGVLGRMAWGPVDLRLMGFEGLKKAQVCSC